MNLLLFHRDEFNQLYGCDGINVDKIPLANRTDIVNGCLLIALFIFFELLYIPCMVSMSKKLDIACYKLLFFIGILDMLVLFVNALETGILGIIGAVYCDFPIFIYITGTIGLSLWYAETCAELLLAINRCMELLNPQLAHAIFSGNKTWVLCAVPICYAIAMGWYTKPILFSGVYLSWFFNPYVGYVDDFGKIYHSTLHTVHDCFVIFGLSTIYALFSAMLIWQTHTIVSHAYRPTLAQKMSFLQVVIISIFNAICSGIYISMQLVRFSKLYIIVGTYTWIFAHGCPPVVYLLLNGRIRNDCANFARAILRIVRNESAIANGQIISGLVTAQNDGGTNANNKIHQIPSPLIGHE